MQPGKYDMTPDLATELHLSKHTLRVRPDGTGIFILSPGRTPTSLSIDHPQKVQQTLAFDRQTIQLPNDANKVIVATDYYERFQQGKDLVIFFDGTKPCREQPKLIFSAIRHVA